MNKGSGHVTDYTQDDDFVRLLKDHLEGLDADEFELSMDATRVVEWVGETFDPEEIFSFEQLQEWALQNNFEQVQA